FIHFLLTLVSSRASSFSINSFPLLTSVVSFSLNHIIFLLRLFIFKDDVERLGLDHNQDNSTWKEICQEEKQGCPVAEKLIESYLIRGVMASVRGCGGSGIYFATMMFQRLHGEFPVA
ncbi:hypothetical protein VIGAN_02191400, partial [Vigna angularis var. angularis]